MLFVTTLTTRECCVCVCVCVLGSGNAIRELLFTLVLQLTHQITGEDGRIYPFVLAAHTPAVVHPVADALVSALVRIAFVWLAADAAATDDVIDHAPRIAGAVRILLGDASTVADVLPALIHGVLSVAAATSERQAVREGVCALWKNITDRRPEMLGQLFR